MEQEVKKIIAIVLAAVLIAGGLGSFAYAQVNSPVMTGQKLVGSGYLGEHYDEESGATFRLHTMFGFTNPDGVSEITIDRVSIFHRDGIVLYEGALKWDDGILAPHEVQAVELHDYLDSGDLIPVTVEIFWTGSDRKGLPLTGWQLSTIGLLDAEENLVEMTSSESQMVNMEQVLEPEEVLRLQTWLQPDDSLMQPLKNFAQAVEQRSGGAIRIQLYSANALVPNEELANTVRQGDVEMGLIHTGWLRDYSRVMDAGSLPFLYNDADGLMTAVQAGVGDLLTQELKAHNIIAIDWTAIGIAHLFSRTEMLDDPGDVAGLKIRTFGIQAEAITEWGGTRVLMPLKELYQALEEEKIHGAILLLHAYDSFKLYEVAPYFCVDYAFGNLAALCINSDVWNSLDEETRQIITGAADEFAVEMLETVKDIDAEALRTIKDYGVEVYTLSAGERLVWRQASQPVWNAWVALEDVGSVVGEAIISIALEHNPLP